MGHKRLSQLLAALAISLAFAAHLSASLDRGAVHGTITDPQGGLVPGAKVVVRNNETNVELNLTTNATGFYLAPELVPGKYSVHISAPGFSPLDVDNVTVTAGSTTNLDEQLQVGATSQRVEVTTVAPLVDEEVEGKEQRQVPSDHGEDHG